MQQTAHTYTISWQQGIDHCMAGAGSDQDAGQYGASSSDSEGEGPTELQLTGRRPSTTNYRPEFAAKTLAQASVASTAVVCVWRVSLFILTTCYKQIGRFKGTTHQRVFY